MMETGKSPPRPMSELTLAEAVETYLDRLPVNVKGAELGPGARATLAITDSAGSKRNEAYYLFVEMMLPKTPPDPEVGYTREDAIWNKGVLVFTHLGNSRSFGEYITLERFIKAKQVDRRTATRLRLKLDGMAAMIPLTESFLAEVNAQWKDRKAGQSSIIGPEYLH